MAKEQVTHFFDGSMKSPCGDSDEESIMSPRVNDVTCQGCLAVMLREYDPKNKKPVLH